MINDFLAFWTPGPIEVIVTLVVLGIPILLIVLFFKHLSKSNKERQRLRLELGKLADELEQIRKQKQGNEKDGSTS